VFIINVKFLYLNALKRNLEIAFLRYSREFVTSVITITEFDCMIYSLQQNLVMLSHIKDLRMMARCMFKRKDRET
jgi:hypothetical protein